MDWFVNSQGFYIWSDNSYVNGFEYSGTNLPDGISDYRILTSINGQYYHKNTTNVFAKVGNLLGGNFVEKKIYDPSEESFNDELVINAATLGVFKVAGYAGSLLKSSGGSLWKIPGIRDKGFAYELLRGGNLATNYPVIDKFVNGVATSIKTLDLKSKTYLENPKAVYNVVKGYVDKLKKFEGVKW